MENVQQENVLYISIFQGFFLGFKETFILTVLNN